MACTPVIGQDLNILVPAISGYPNSRPAHFNWTFISSGGGEVRMGQFACGSWWVAPAVGDSEITMVSLTGKTDDPDWHDLLSCDADPITERHGLLSGENSYGNYFPEENIIPQLPLTFAPPAESCVSLVAAMQRNEAETSKGGTKAILGEVADAYCVVTLVPKPPPDGGIDMIRPNITGSTKEFLTWEDFDLTRLPGYSFLDSYSPASWENVALRWRHSTEIFGVATEHERWGSIRYSEGGRAFRAANLISNYAAGMTATFNSDVLALLSEATDIESVKSALGAMLAFGLDLYHCRFDYGVNKRKAWSSGAGQSGGQFLPTVLLAALLKDDTKANELRKTAIENYGPDPMNLGPQELRQIMRGVTGVPLWGDGNPFLRNGNSMVEFDWRAWGELKGAGCYDTSATPDCSPYSGKKTVADPYGYMDGPVNSPGSSYMSVSSGGVRGLAAVMVLMPRVRWVVNSDAPIEYADRIVRHGLWTAPDPVAPPTEEDELNGCELYWSAKGCVDFGILYGPVESDVRFAIENGIGRYVSKHGLPVSPGYESGQAASNWKAIIDLYNGQTFEDTAVPLGTLVAPEIRYASSDNPVIHIWSPNPEAEIHYTLDGSTPTRESALYTGPVSVPAQAWVKARAFAGPVDEDVINMTLYPQKDPSPVSSRQVLSFEDVDTTPPTSPTDLSVKDIGHSSAQLTWTASEDAFGIDFYQVSVGDFVFDATTTNFSLENLEPFSAYKVKVRAVDTNGNRSTYSEQVAFITKSGSTQSNKWGDGTVDKNGDVDTGTLLGWINLTENNWAWSYTLDHWIYAPDPGKAAPGFWIFFPRQN